VWGELRSLTQYELELQFRGAQQRLDGWYQLARYTAWYVAYWSRLDKLPSLKTVEEELEAQRVKADRAATKPARRQTWQEQKAIMASVRALAVKAPPAKPKRRKR